MSQLVQIQSIHKFYWRIVSDRINKMKNTDEKQKRT